MALTTPGVTTYGATATQSCKTGYTLSGNTVILCKSTGSWSASVTCSIKGNHVFKFKEKEMPLPRGTNLSPFLTISIAITRMVLMRDIQLPSVASLLKDLAPRL